MEGPNTPWHASQIRQLADDKSDDSMDVPFSEEKCHKSERAATPDPHTPGHTLLALPGWRSNGDIATLQLDNLGLARHFHVHILNGPIISPQNQPADEGVALLSKGPYFSWIENSDQGHAENRDADDGAFEIEGMDVVDRVTQRRARSRRPVLQRSDSAYSVESSGSSSAVGAFFQMPRRRSNDEGRSSVTRSQKDHNSKDANPVPSDIESQCEKETISNPDCPVRRNSGRGSVRSQETTSNPDRPVRRFSGRGSVRSQETISNPDRLVRKYSVRGSAFSQVKPVSVETTPRPARSKSDDERSNWPLTSRAISQRSLGHGSVDGDSADERVRRRTSTTSARSLFANGGASTSGGGHGEDLNEVTIDQIMASLRYALENLHSALMRKAETFNETNDDGGEPVAYAFDAVYGFSQGAAVATILSCDATRRALLDVFGMPSQAAQPPPRDDPAHQPPSPSDLAWPAFSRRPWRPWRFAIMGCAANIRVWRAVNLQITGRAPVNLRLILSQADRPQRGEVPADDRESDRRPEPLSRRSKMLRQQSAPILFLQDDDLTSGRKTPPLQIHEDGNTALVPSESGDVKINVPSVHIMGVNDSLRSESEFFFRLFSPETSLSLYLDGGHEIPSLMKDREQIADDTLFWMNLMEHCERSDGSVVQALEQCRARRAENPEGRRAPSLNGARSLFSRFSGRRGPDVYMDDEEFVPLNHSGRTASTASMSARRKSSHSLDTVLGDLSTGDDVPFDGNSSMPNLGSVRSHPQMVVSYEHGGQDAPSPAPSCRKRTISIGSRGSIARLLRRDRVQEHVSPISLVDVTADTICFQHDVTASDSDDTTEVEDVANLTQSTSAQHILTKIRHSNDGIFPMLCAAPDPDGIALCSFGVEPSVALTYRDILTFIRGEGDLRRVGGRKGNVVAYIPPPSGSGVTAALAFLTIASQSTAAPLDPSYSEKDYEMAFEQLRPDIVVAFDSVKSVPLRRLASKFSFRLVLAEHDGNGRFTYRHPETREKFVTEEDFIPSVPLLINTVDCTGLLLRTSGTTSKPKIVPLTVGSIVSNAKIIAQNLGLMHSDVALNAMPLFHIGGISANLMSSLAAGASVILVDQFDADSFFAALMEGSRDILPTWYSAVPTMHATITAAAERAKTLAPADFKHGLRFIRTGAADMPTTLARKMESVFGVPLLTTYSMTEQMPISQPPGLLSLITVKPKSVGKPVASSICVVDAGLRPIPVESGLSGEICISGQNVFNGYSDNPTANSKSFFYIGPMKWFRTGDFGYLDSDGFLFLTGRIKEMVKRGGEQINPIEVEERCLRYPFIDSCVAFAIEDRVWGQRIGLAIVIQKEKRPLFGKEDDGQLTKQLRRFLIEDGLQDFKVPEKIVFVTEDQIPKTASNKVIRIGLATKLGVKPMSDDVIDRLRDLRPVQIAESLYGVRFLLSMAIFFVHIGDFGVDWDHARYFCLHMPAFFFVGGFSLAVSSQNPVTSDLLNFYGTRVAVLHPMFLLALVCGTINFVLRCNPSNYHEEFERNRMPEDGEEFICQATPMESSYGGTMVSSLLIHIFSLHAWPISVPVSWFLLNYGWFQSVYYFCIFVFPWVHRSFHNRRFSRQGTWELMVIWVTLSYVVVAAFYFYLPIREENPVTGNFFALIGYLFPPGWLPCFALGVGSYFLLAQYRPNENSWAWKWGVLTDVLSILMLIVFLLFGMNVELTTARMIRNFIDQRFFAFFLSRILSPVIFLWMFGLAIGKGLTARLMSLRPVVTWLAPAGYNIYLFHQIVGEWYYFATRGRWWSYPKDFYWFSPLPLAVSPKEVIVVAILTILFSIFLECTINGWMVAKFTEFIMSITGSAKEVKDDDAEPEDVVIGILKSIMQVEDVTTETNLSVTGLSSMTTLLLVNDIKRQYKSLRLSVRDVLTSKTVGDLVAVIERRLGALDTKKDKAIDEDLDHGVP